MSCDFFFGGTLQMTRDLCIFLFFHFADDMGVCVFWVCPTTPMSSAGTIIMVIFHSFVSLPKGNSKDIWW